MSTTIKYLNAKGEWIGPVAQRRAERAVIEAPIFAGKKNIDCAFHWNKSKEGRDYWHAVYFHYPDPDQYLPEGYVDVEVSPNNNDVRNKLSPIKNLIKMLENGLVKGDVEMHDLVLKEIEVCKESIAYLSSISPAKPEPSEEELRELFKKHADQPVYSDFAGQYICSYMSEDKFVEVVKELLTTQRG